MPEARVRRFQMAPSHTRWMSNPILANEKGHRGDKRRRGRLAPPSRPPNLSCEESHGFVSEQRNLCHCYLNRSWREKKSNARRPQGQRILSGNRLLPFGNPACFLRKCVSQLDNYTADSVVKEFLTTAAKAQRNQFFRFFRKNFYERFST